MAAYRITEQAIRDLDEIWNYTFDKWSVEQANRYYNRIISEIEYISENKMAASSMDDVREGFRKSKVKYHLIFYRQGADDIVEVIRILHERMDVKNRLSE